MRPVSPRLAALVLVLGLAATACDLSITFSDGIEGSGDVVAESFDLDGFDRIDIANTFDVAITVGPATSVVIETDDNIAEYLDIKVRDRVLEIRLDDVSLRRGTLVASIELPTLESLEVSGASSVRATGLDEAVFDLAVSGASEVTLTGSAADLDLDASGASDVRLDGLQVETARVDISGASDVRLGDAAAVRGGISGASDLTISSGADADVDTSGASSINRS